MGEHMGKQQHILIVGDVVLDRYLHGRHTRRNPEGDGQVFHIDHVDERLGGAAAVACALQDAERFASLFGVVGADAAGQRITQLCRERGIDSLLLAEHNRITPTKDRLVECDVLLPGRIDCESTEPISSAAEYQLLRQINSHRWAAVLVADYGKGTVSAALLAAVASLDCPVIIDPSRNRSWWHYPQNAIIKANLIEAREWANQPEGEAEALLHALDDHNRLVITAGADGVYWKDGTARGHSRGLSVDTVDVTGAGDTVLAILGASLASGASLGEACDCGNRAAAAKITRLGASLCPVETVA